MELARLLSDLGCVKQRRYDGGRANPHGHAGLDELAAALFVRLVEIIFVRHATVSMASARPWKAA